jgi:hypothetical protein
MFFIVLVVEKGKQPFGGVIAKGGSNGKSIYNKRIRKR